MIVPNPDDLPPITQAEALRIMQRSDQAPTDALRRLLACASGVRSRRD